MHVMSVVQNSGREPGAEYVIEKKKLSKVSSLTDVMGKGADDS